LKTIGHPVLGDQIYASPGQRAMADRLMLHASTLTVRHPQSGEPLTIEAPCPWM
jgi:tRNA pseudouridine32 synthase/23S rRNA pseudouridine746 synthase